MATKKIINSIEVEEADFGKTVTIDSNGDVQLVEIRPSYIPITAGTIDPHQEGDSTYVYNISEFEGVGIDTDGINQIHIQTYIYQTWDEAANKYIQVKYPDGTFQTIHRMDRSNVSGPDVSERQEHIFSIPINLGQSTFEVLISSHNTETQFTIIAASQLEV